MASFANDASSHDRLDFELLAGGGIALYHSKDVLAEDVAWLRREGYALRELACAAWTSEEAFHAEVARTFEFPAYYGRNLDAFADCLGDVEVPERDGLAVVLRAVEGVRLRGGKLLWEVLDVFAGVIRSNLLVGRRLVVLAQSNDPRFELEPVGAMVVTWNRREWLDKKRGL